jgi:hypothetical protein
MLLKWASINASRSWRAIGWLKSHRMDAKTSKPDQLQQTRPTGRQTGAWLPTEPCTEDGGAEGPSQIRSMIWKGDSETDLVIMSNAWIIRAFICAQLKREVIPGQINVRCFVARRIAVEYNLSGLMYVRWSVDEPFPQFYSRVLIFLSSIGWIGDNCIVTDRFGSLERI